MPVTVRLAPVAFVKKTPWRLDVPEAVSDPTEALPAWKFWA
jgi:hypothetical protein